MFNKESLSYIDPSRVPKETITNKIVNNIFEGDQVDFDGYTLVGVVRSQQSPSAEKNIILIKDKHKKYWAIVSISNIAQPKHINPIVE